MPEVPRKQPYVVSVQKVTCSHRTKKKWLSLYAVWTTTEIVCIPSALSVIRYGYWRC